MKRLIALMIALLLFAVPAFAASGDTATPAPSDSATQAPDTSLDDIKAKGTFVLGLDDSFPPMGYRNEQNEIVGFDIDVAREVCARLGVQLVLQPISWSAKELELSSKNIDCIWNGMSITPDREESMALSTPYMNNRIVLVVKDGSYTSMDQLAGKSVAVQSGSFAEEVLTTYPEYADFYKSLSEVPPHEDYLTALMDLNNGNVAAVLIDVVVFNYYKTTSGDTSLTEIASLADDLYAVGFRKGDLALRDAVDAILAEMAADGKLAEISTKWFGQDITIVGKAKAE